MPVSSVPLITQDTSANTLVAYKAWLQTFSQNVCAHLTPPIPVLNANPFPFSVHITMHFKLLG